MNEYTTHTDHRGEYLMVRADKGHFLIDIDDRDQLIGRAWSIYVRIDPHNKYVKCTEGGKVILLHREILSSPKGLTVDHRDWDGLNNRRYNIRLATTAQNYSHVRPGSRRGGHPATGLPRGVYIHKDGYIYSNITTGCKTRYIGRFESVEAAARAWDKEALASRGEFAVLNYPITR